LETRLRERRDAGRRLLVPYVTGGVTADWTDYVRSYVDAGADAVEVGLPFSDPMLEGVTIQRSSHAALCRGATPPGILAELAALAVPVPLVVMTYGNLVSRAGSARFCAALSAAGVAGLIVPDLPVDESAEVASACAAERIDLPLLASPVTPAGRRDEIAARSRGFVYAVAVMGTTGVRATVAEAATRLAADLKRRTDRPVLLGFGIATPEQAARAAGHADGVIVGAALMQQVLDGAGPARVGARVAELRAALDREGADG
jgi:tryptophan synthase alpha chain